MWTASLERNFNGSRIVGHALERSSIYTTEWNESENVLNMSQPVPCPNHLEPHFMLNTCHFPNCTSEHLMVKMVQQDIGRSSLVMAAQPLRMLLPFPTNNQQLNLLHSSSFLIQHVNSRHLRRRGTCATAGGSCTWRAWGTWAWRARGAWGGGRCRCLNEANKLCSSHDMLVEHCWARVLRVFGYSWRNH